MAAATFTEQLKRETNSVLRYLPLVSSPAIKSDEYALNHNLIIARTASGLALSLIAMLALYWAFPAVALFVAKYETAAIFGSILLSYIPGIIEFWRASRAVDRLAADEYRNPTPSNTATDRLCSSPGAFRYVLDTKENLHKVDRRGMSLASKILSSAQSSPRVGRMLVDTGIDLLAPDAEGESLFMFAVQNPNPATLKYILKSKKVQAANIDEQSQAAIWKHVGQADLVKLLCEYGFNINARDAAGATPLMHWAQKPQGGRSLCVAALNAKANPLLQSPQGQKASDLARPNSLSRSLLLQAEEEYDKAPIPLPKERSLTSWLPWKPFVCKDSFSYTPDHTSLSNRVLMVWLTVVALAWFTLNSIPKVALQILTGSSLISIPLLILESWRSGKEAERQAVVEYLTHSIPSHQATQTICRSATAARLLIAHSPQSALNKLDDEGNSLLGKYGPDRNAFKLLVDHGANLFAGVHQTGFLRAVQDTRPDLLAYILDRKRVQIQDVPVGLQVQMWTSIGSEQAARFLKQYGFNPDVQDADGNTSLMHLAQEENFLEETSFHIRVLLAVGANPRLTNRAGQTAKDLARNPRIAALL